LGVNVVKNTLMTLVCVASLGLAAQATAGSLSDPVVAPEVVVQETTQASDPQKMYGLLAALTIALIIVGKGSGS
jgi:hypothetical protein